MLSRTTKEHPSRGLAVDIISSIDDDAMVDIVLLSNDGGEIPASRFILGARSPVLRKMLFQTKSTNNQYELKIDHSTTVVRALAYYCRTNELDDSICSPKNEESVRELVKLCQCAIELELSGLETLVGNLTSCICQVDPHLACTFYDEAACCGGKPAVESIKFVALGFIRRNPEPALLRKNQPRGNYFFGGISSLQADSLKELLSDSELCCDEVTIFRAIVLWAEAPSKQDQKMDAWATQILLHNRREAAKPIVAQCIDLSKIAPSDLLGIVAESRLVEETDISNALIQIALRVETEGVQLSKRRSHDLKVVPRSTSSPPPPPPLLFQPPQLSYACFEEETDSVVDILGDLTFDQTNTSSFTYAPVEQGNKRKPSKQQPNDITPPRKPDPTFITPERPPSSPSRDVPSGASARSISKKKSRRARKNADREKSTIGSRIREAVAIFLRDKVDSVCIHPNHGEHDDDDEAIVPPPPPR